MSSECTYQEYNIRKKQRLFETDPCPSAATMEPLGTTSTVPSITGSGGGRETVEVVDVVVVEVVAVDEEKEGNVVEECVDVE